MKEKTSRGVMYCAVGAIKYLEAALISALALRQLEPDLPIIIISDFDGLDSQQLEMSNISIKTIFIPKSWRLASANTSRLIKTSLNTLTEFEETLYLDADILPLKPIHEIWRFLEQEDIAMAVDVNPTLIQCNHVSQLEKKYTLQVCSPDSVQFNGGVMLWRNSSAATALFDAWKQEWLRFKKHDQLALIRAIQSTQTSIVELPNSYNFPIVQVTSDILKQNVIVFLHCWGGLVQSDRFNTIARKLMPSLTAKVSEKLFSYVDTQFSHTGNYFFPGSNRHRHITPFPPEEYLFSK